MQIKYLTEFSWDAKVIGEVIVENEEQIAPGFLKMDSKMYPKNWILRKMFNENDGEIIIRGEKNILKYNSKDKEYWLINIDEYFNKEKKDTVSQAPLSRSLFFSIIFDVKLLLSLFLSNKRFFFLFISIENFIILVLFFLSILKKIF